RLQALRGAVLPLPLPAAASARAGAELRRGRRAGCAPRRDRVAPGERGAEALARDRRPADRAPDALRRALGPVRRGRRAARPELPGLRRAPDDHGVHRLRRVLRGPRVVTVVRIPPTLREEPRGQAAWGADGDPVGELLDDLTSRFPQLRERIYDDGRLASFVNVYVGGEDIRTREGLETPVSGGTVILLPAMAGGR